MRFPLMIAVAALAATAPHPAEAERGDHNADAAERRNEANAERRERERAAIADMREARTAIERNVRDSEARDRAMRAVERWREMEPSGDDGLKEQGTAVADRIERIVKDWEHVGREP